MRTTTGQASRAVVVPAIAYRSVMAGCGTATCLSTRAQDTDVTSCLWAERLDFAEVAAMARGAFGEHAPKVARLQDEQAIGALPLCSELSRRWDGPVLPRDGFR